MIGGFISPPDVLALRCHRCGTHLDTRTGMPATLLTSTPRPQQVPGELTCPECDAERPDPLQACPACGAPPVHPDLRMHEEEVRDEDLQPYVALRYIARLFKVLAALMLVLYIGEVITGVTT